MDFTVLTRFFRYMPPEAVLRMTEELKARKHRLLVIRPLEVRLRQNDSGPVPYFMGQKWQKSDLLIPLLRSNDDYGWAVVEQLSAYGQASLKTPRLPHQDRVAMTKLFDQHGVRVPTSFVLNRAGIWKQKDNMPWPLQVNARLEQNGRLLKVVNNWDELDSTLLEYEQILEEPVLLRDASELNGPVVSVLVVGDKVVTNIERPDGLMQVLPGRQAAAQLTLRQALLKPGRLTAQTEKMAVLVRRIYGVTHAVVDMRQTPKGPLLLDVNIAPNIAWFERMSGQNLMGQVIDFWEQVARAVKR